VWPPLMWPILRCIWLWKRACERAVRNLARAQPEGWVEITHAMPIRGIATSGRPGRSFSCGVADAVTVPAGRAADADAAATIIANAVDAAHRGIQHAPACSLDPDSDLSDILVTTGVDPLPVAVVEGALNAGVRVAEALREGGLIFAALLFCQERARVCGDAGLGLMGTAGVPTAAASRLLRA
jgi:hypothetical protein